MRIISFVVAALVAVGLYLMVIERDRVFEFAGRVQSVTPADAETGAPDGQPDTPDVAALSDADPATQEATDGVAVVAVHSAARPIDSLVRLRGQTEAARQVILAAETSGRIASEPLRKGRFVDEGEAVCEIAPGTRQVTRTEMLARLAEAEARLPEARARLTEAEAAVPAALARIGEAEARVPEATARLAEAQASVITAGARLREAKTGVPTAEARLIEAEASLPTAEARLQEALANVPAAEARLAEARANVPAAEARLREAEARVPAAAARLVEAQSRLPESAARLVEAEARVTEASINLNAAEQLASGGFAADTRVAAARAGWEAAQAGVKSAQSAQEAARSGIENAQSDLEGAAALIETTRAQVESARAAVQSALGAVEGSKAQVQAAMGQVESARALIQAAKGQVESADAQIQAAMGQVESAKAAVQSARSQLQAAEAGVISASSGLESAHAGVQSAKSGVANAQAGIQSAEAAVATADKEIERLIIHAPFAGVLEADTAELGALLQPGAVCATILQLDPIKLVGFIPETEIDKVTLGAQAGARLATGREVIGDVTFIGRSADAATRTFRIEVEIPNPDLAIRDGQTVEMVVSSGKAAAHLLPQSALTLDDNGNLGVRVIDDAMQADFVPVRVLRDTVDGIWLDGLPEQADVIIIGQEYVISGVPVRPSFEGQVE